MLFIDPMCAKPYRAAVLDQEILGGTEATVIRLLSVLPQASVMQHNRAYAHADEPRFTELRWDRLPKDAPIVVLRDFRVALHVRALGWRGPLYLWMHDFLELWGGMSMPALHQAGVEVIAVSEWHRAHIVAITRAVIGELAPLPRMRVIFNPLAPGLAPSAAPADPDRLCYISSPHKGLPDVLRHFQAVRARHPSVELHIANPANVPGVDAPGVHVHGNLLHADAMRLMGESYCLFYPNQAYPETFGIVYAEANALGTPVLAHDFGAVGEVLNDPRQLVDAYAPGAVADRYSQWRAEGRPKVAARPEFALETVAEAWRGLL